MEKQFTVDELMELDVELTITSSQRVKHLAKYLLDLVQTQVKKQIGMGKEIKEELVQKLGIPDGYGNYSIPQFIGGKENENFKKFKEEWEPIGSDKKILKFRPIPFNLIETIDAEGKYPNLYRVFEMPVFDEYKEDIKAETKKANSRKKEKATENY